MWLRGVAADAQLNDLLPPTSSGMNNRFIYALIITLCTHFLIIFERFVEFYQLRELEQILYEVSPDSSSKKKKHIEKHTFKKTNKKVNKYID